MDEAIAYLKEKGTRVNGMLVKAKSITSGILKLAEEYDACMIGAAKEGLMQQILFGSIPERIAKKSHHTLIMVKKHQSALQNIISRMLKRPKGRIGKK